MHPIPPELAGHPDRLRWNARYSGAFTPSFTPHPLGKEAMALPMPDGPVLELACGPSGSALLAAAAGRPVTAVDASDVALGLLAGEARRRGLDGLITLVHADLGSWRPAAAAFSLVLCTGYLDRAVFAYAITAVRDGGLLAWEALTEAARRDRPHLPAEWCVGPGEPASLLPPGFVVLSQQDAGPEPPPRRRLLATRRD
jgi:SAM-dependent methyltransferase